MKKDISIFSTIGRKSAFDVVIGTHSGIFHADEVVAISLLRLYHEEETLAVVRSRELEELSKCNILVDIGGGKFDHHQPGGNGARKNGIRYASAGLIWQEFGQGIVVNLANKAEFKLDAFQIATVTSKIDDIYIQRVDEIDNGVPCDDDVFSYISAFLPDWNYSRDIAFNKAFAEVIEVTTTILRKLICKAIEEEYSFAWVISSIAKNHTRIFEIPAQTFPWQEPILLCNGCYYQPIDFVIFPYPAGGWAAQCVPPSAAMPFAQRIPFPKSWAGQTDNLPEISGIPKATFCHNNLFFARADTKETVIKMCEKAIEIFENSKKK